MREAFFPRFTMSNVNQAEIYLISLFREVSIEYKKANWKANWEKNLHKMRGKTFFFLLSFTYYGNFCILAIVGNETKENNLKIYVW